MCDTNHVWHGNMALEPAPDLAFPRGDVADEAKRTELSVWLMPRRGRRLFGWRGGRWPGGPGGLHLCV